jgi:hypothetical protein
MQNISRIIVAHPKGSAVDAEQYMGLLGAIGACAAVCTICSDACLSESAEQLDMLRTCIALNDECAAVCAATVNAVARFGSGDQSIARAALEACKLACDACATECERHEHEHCRICAESCRSCASACEQMMSAVGAGAMAGAHA